MKLKHTIAASLILLALCSACDTRSTGGGDTVKPPVTAGSPVRDLSPAAVPVAQNKPEVICGLYVDVSPSVDAATEQTVGAALDESLDAFIDRNRCTEIRYGAFASEGAFLVPQRVLLPGPVAEGAHCDQPLSAEDRALQFLPGAIAAAKKRCHDKADKERERALKTRKEKLKVLRDFLTAPPGRRGTCTNLVGLLRMLDRSRGDDDVDVIVSDGAETCAREVPSITVHHRVILVQCPRSGNLQVTGPEALARAQSLEAEVTNLHVVLPAEVTSSFWSVEGGTTSDGRSLRERALSAPLIASRN